MPETLKKPTVFCSILGIAVAVVAACLPSLSLPVAPVLYLIALLLTGGKVFHEAMEHLFKGKLLDENFLMSLAAIGAFATQHYSEGIAVMVFYQVGELFQDRAMDRSRESLTTLMDLRPDHAMVMRQSAVVSVKPEDVRTGEVIVLYPGDRVPLDGVVLEGRTSLNTAALTGESLPREIGPGDSIISGCINESGRLLVRVTGTYAESTVNRILEMAEHAADKKSKPERFITAFSRRYTPIVVLLAVLLAVLPPLLLPDASWSVWLYRALQFLVVSCPCALVLSIPLSFFCGIGRASKKNILIKGSSIMEALAHTHTVALDKTGTLTSGTFAVQHIQPQHLSEQQLLHLATYAEQASHHPIARALITAYGKAPEQADRIEELAGKGIVTTFRGCRLAVGNALLMEEEGISELPVVEGSGTPVHVALEGHYGGYIVVADSLKPDAEQAVTALRDLGIAQVVLLTGDVDAIGQQVGQKLRLNEVHTELLPAEKVEQVERLLTELPSKGKLLFAGDGINDAPVLARADIGVAMGGIGSDAAIEAADVVIMNDRPAGIAEAIRISRQTMSIVWQNTICSIAVKLIIMITGAWGLTGIWAALFADVGVSVLAVLNAMRAFWEPKSIKK